MKETIWKYELEITDKQTLSLPPTSCFLAVQEQKGKLMLWARVDPNQLPVERTILIHGTGHPISPEEKYIGTAQTTGGFLVWHVFEA